MPPKTTQQKIDENIAAKKGSDVQVEDGLTGESKDTSVLGAISTASTFLASDINKTVYIQTNGSLGTNVTSFPFGRIINTNQLIIHNG